MNQVNQKIIQSIIQKAECVCPDALALIGVYGSVATGDDYEKSDLDLLILIENEQGRALATGMILQDSGVGYDLYCTAWESLRGDAECRHAYLSKLMDSHIVYVGKEDALDRLQGLQAQAREILLSEARLDRARGLLHEAKFAYADLCFASSLGRTRFAAAGVIDAVACALMLYEGRYFRLGTKRFFEELGALLIQKEIPSVIRRIVTSANATELQELAGKLLRLTEAYLHAEVEEKAPNRQSSAITPKRAPSHELQGTYEEMFSNWRNKVAHAAAHGDAFSSYMGMCGLHGMLSELAGAYDIAKQDVMGAYDPVHLDANVAIFDRALAQYEREYARAGIKVHRFANVDEFVKAYLGE